MLRQLKYSNGKEEIEIGQGQNSPFLLTDVQGLGYSNEIYTTTSIYQDGETVNGFNLKMRNITIELSIIKNYIVNRNKLYNVFTPKKEGTFYYIQGDIKRKANAYVESVDTAEKNDVQTVVISLLCPDPFFYDLQDTFNYMATWEKGFYFPVPYGIETVVFGTRNNEQVKNIINYGNAKTPIIIHFNNNYPFKITNPSLIKIETGEFMKVNETISQNESIIINTKTKRIEKGDLNIFRKRVRGSQFFMLDVGDNYFRFDADENVEYLDVVIEYNSAYLGV